MGYVTVRRLRRLHDKRHVRVAGTYLAQQTGACLRVFLSLAGERGVGDDPEDVVLVLLVEAHCLLVGACQHDFRTSAHTQRPLVAVECLGGELLALLQHEAVEVGQHGRVEADGVLHHENHLYSDLLDVVRQVHLVLDELDDGEQQVGVAQPAEDILEDAQVLVFHAGGDAVRERGEHDERDVRVTLLDAVGNVERVAVVAARHADDQVVAHLVEPLPRLLHGRHLCEARRVAEAQVHVLVEHLLVDASVVFEHERVVGVGYQQDVIDALRHQVDERSVLEVELVQPLFEFVYHSSVVLSSL